MSCYWGCLSQILNSRMNRCVRFRGTLLCLCVSYLLVAVCGLELLSWFFLHLWLVLPRSLSVMFGPFSPYLLTSSQEALMLPHQHPLNLPHQRPICQISMTCPIASKQQIALLGTQPMAAPMAKSQLGPQHPPIPISIHLN